MDTHIIPAILPDHDLGEGNDFTRACWIFQDILTFPFRVLRLLLVILSNGIVLCYYLITRLIVEIAKCIEQRWGREVGESFVNLVAGSVIGFFLLASIWWTLVLLFEVIRFRPTVWWLQLPLPLPWLRAVEQA